MLLERRINLSFNLVVQFGDILSGTESLSGCAIIKKAVNKLISKIKYPHAKLCHNYCPIPIYLERIWNGSGTGMVFVIKFIINLDSCQEHQLWMKIIDLLSLLAQRNILKMKKYTNCSTNCYNPLCISIYPLTLIYFLESC